MLKLISCMVNCLCLEELEVERKKCIENDQLSFKVQKKVRVFPFFGSVTLSRNHYKNILLALLCNIYWPLTSISSSVNLDKIALHLSAYSKSTASFSSSFCSLFSASLLVWNLCRFHFLLS